ncbi:MAG TPA: nuclear transport factor 2 family protein [Candidatus Binatia bacterium]|nr:nuclear transport factor 2 family protein [Candidatus Binatia bacterium]
MADQNDIEAIKQLKYRYFRALDTKEWDELGRTLSDDASTSYGSGKFAYSGREAILEFLRSALGSSRLISMHHGHHPEIELTGTTTARGTWYLQDKVIFLDANTILTGAAFYADEYVKIGGEWKISSTGYERTFEMIEVRQEPLSIRTRFDPAE